jgi:hypothetical protein
MSGLVEDLCSEAKGLLDQGDNSVLSELLRAQILVGLAIVELLSELREELRKGKK